MILCCVYYAKAAIVEIESIKTMWHARNKTV